MQARRSLGKLERAPFKMLLAFGVLGVLALGAFEAAAPPQALAASGGVWHGVSYDIDDSGCATFHAGEMTGDFDKSDPFAASEGLKDATSVRADGRVVLPEDSGYLFYSCANLVSIDMTGFDSSKATNMELMFDGCTGLVDLDVSALDTSQVWTMNGMFCECPKLASLDVSRFDTARVQYMGWMFSDCSSLQSLDVTHFDTWRVATMYCMFAGCRELSSLDVSGFDTSEVQSMGMMFQQCQSLTTLDVSHFNTAQVKGMESMFNGCSSLQALDVSGFDTSMVTTMNAMFGYCRGLTALDVSNFNTSKVRNFIGMFMWCSNLTSLDVKLFNTSRAFSFNNMFRGCQKLTSLDVSLFDTSAAENMSAMFETCGSLTSLDLSSFDTSNVEEMNEIFTGCVSLREIRLGRGFSFSGAGTSRIENSAFPGAYWRSSASGMVYRADSIPSKVEATYSYVSPSEVRVLIKKGQTASLVEVFGDKVVTLRVRAENVDKKARVVYVSLRKVSAGGNSISAAANVAARKAKTVLPKTLAIPEPRWNAKLQCTVVYVRVAPKALWNAKNVKTVSLPSTVTRIGKQAFGKSSVTTLQLCTRLLAKKSVKGSLQDSKMKTVQVKVAAKYRAKTKKKYATAFAKKNSGRKVKVS